MLYVLSNIASCFSSDGRVHICGSDRRLWKTEIIVLNYF